MKRAHRGAARVAVSGHVAVVRRRVVLEGMLAAQLEQVGVGDEMDASGLGPLPRQRLLARPARDRVEEDDALEQRHLLGPAQQRGQVRGRGEADARLRMGEDKEGSRLVVAVVQGDNRARVRDGTEVDDL